MQPFFSSTSARILQGDDTVYSSARNLPVPGFLTSLKRYNFLVTDLDKNVMLSLFMAGILPPPPAYLDPPLFFC